MLKKAIITWLGAIHNLGARPKTRELKANARFVLQSANLNLPLSRNEKLMQGCEHRGVGLEIGPSYCPVASKKAGYRVEVLDHADTVRLREKYQGHNVDVARIEEVDYVWSGQPLHELTGKKSYYDWIVASHVIEHTPDMVSFLQQNEIMLKPGGLLCLAVPDHRYCFDVFRPASTPGEVIQAYLEKRRRHSLAAIWDHCSLIVRKGGEAAWHKGHCGEYQFIHPDLQQAQAMLQTAQESDSYIDVHNWRFTPSSFKLIIHDIGVLGYTSLSNKTFFDTEGCEFIIQLQKGTSENRTHDDRTSLVHEVLKEARCTID
jgi:SAM-dependent methyltransferase